MLNIKTFTEVHAARILELYEEIIGGNIHYLDAKYLCTEITTKENSSAWYDGYRIGSRWDGHSKLSFKRDRDGNLTALFNSNFDPRDRKDDNLRYQTALEAGRRFEEAVRALE